MVMGAGPAPARLGRLLSAEMVLTLIAARRVARCRARWPISTSAGNHPAGTYVVSSLAPACTAQLGVSADQDGVDYAQRPTMGVQAQTFGCGSPETYWLHSCRVGGPT